MMFRIPIPISIFAGKLQDAFIAKCFGIGRSYIHISPTLRIDYILPSKRFYSLVQSMKLVHLLFPIIMPCLLTFSCRTQSDKCLYLSEVMSNLKVYNSYTRQKEEFVSITPQHVGMYVCGPTVSGESHLGHARGFITFDVIYRYLLHLGYKVRYVRNITDAGHFEEEGREAEDKIAKKAIRSKSWSPWNLFRNIPISSIGRCISSITWTRVLNLRQQGHIIEQINMIQEDHRGRLWICCEWLGLFRR